MAHVIKHIFLLGFALDDDLLRRELPNLLQPAIPPIVIKAVADDEFIGDFEANPVSFHGNFTFAAFFQEDANFYVRRPELPQALDKGGKREARVEDVVDDEDGSSRPRAVEQVKAVNKTAALGAFVTGQPDARDFGFELDGTEKIGEKKERAIHDTKKKRAFTAIMACDAFAQLSDARANFCLGEEDAARRHGTSFLKLEAFVHVNIDNPSQIVTLFFI
jgi:hypothetical protein